VSTKKKGGVAQKQEVSIGTSQFVSVQGSLLSYIFKIKATPPSRGKGMIPSHRSDKRDLTVSIGFSKANPIL
jgi:hypothetical protein